VLDDAASVDVGQDVGFSGADDGEVAVAAGAVVAG
jgi:hypothetical protein